MTRYVRQLFDTDYRLQAVEVEGEVSDFRIPGSGHAYFTLKDSGASLRCVMWRSEVATQRYLPDHGDRVIAQGHLSVYEAGGQYQLYCRALSPAGLGDLHAQFEALKAKLDAEGLFAPERKRTIPEAPRTVGVVTSASTAAFQDVLNVLRRRNPLLRVMLSPTPVQGDAAAPQIIAALDALNVRDDVDVILVVRGGGSPEDLWCFNDEALARAIAASRLPVISGVGHEIDFTLADFAADLRAPTPSAAAELVTRVGIDELRMGLINARRQLDASAEAAIRARRQALATMQIDLRRLSPQARLDNARQRLDALLMRAQRATVHAVSLRRAQLAGTQRALAAVSPRDTLARGYAIVQSANGHALTDAADAAPGDDLTIHLHRGKLGATVTEQETSDE